VTGFKCFAGIVGGAKLETAKIELLLSEKEFPTMEKIKEIVSSATEQYGECHLTIVDGSPAGHGKRYISFKCQSDKEVPVMAVLEYCVYLLGNIRIFHRKIEFKRG
jgi:hypothetical protein